MIWLLKWLFFGHVHKWKTLENRVLNLTDKNGKISVRGQRYVQQCEGCGIVVKRDLV